MFSPAILLLGVALAIDAAVVTFAIGLLSLDLTPKQKVFRAFIVSGVFGLFQFLMLWLGSYAGYLFTFSSYGYLFQFIVASIFLIIAMKFIQESVKSEEKTLKWGLLPVLLLAFATSIDALASGVSFGTLPHSYLAASEVGLITFSVCLAFYFISQFFKQIPDRWLMRIAALIFIFLGGQIILGLMSRGAL